MTQLSAVKTGSAPALEQRGPLWTPTRRRAAEPPPQGGVCPRPTGRENAQETLNRVLDKWLASSACRHKRSTHAVYETVACRHIRPDLGVYLIKAITAQQVAAFLAGKAVGSAGADPLAPSTICSIITVLRAAFRYAEANGCAVSAWEGLARPKSSARPVYVLTGDEQKQLIAYLAAEDDVERLGVLLCLYTGLRLGEICGLKWGDISEKEGILTVRRTVQRVRRADQGGNGRRTETLFGPPKSQHSARSIPLPSFLLEQLGKERQENGCFVLTGTEKFMEPRVLQNHFKTILARAGVREVNFHCLRHTFATNCVDLGFDPKTLSVILGHADVSVTLNTYVHPSLSKMRSCMELLGTSGVSAPAK